jgi:ISXO2-like transposase domain
VVVIRERGGKTPPGVFRGEAEALHFVRARIAPQTAVYADEAAAWNDLHARFTLHRINHEEAYSLGGEDEINTNAAESFFSRMRRGEIGHHHHVAGPYLIRFAQEAACREDHRRDPNGLQGRSRRDARDAAQAFNRLCWLLATSSQRSGSVTTNGSRGHVVTALIAKRPNSAASLTSYSASSISIEPT